MSSGDNSGNEDYQENTHLEIVERLEIDEGVADEIRRQFSGDLGLIHDLTYEDCYFIVRWHDAE